MGLSWILKKNRTQSHDWGLYTLKTYLYYYLSPKESHNTILN